MKRIISDIHREISEEAVSIANAEAKRSGILPFGVYDVFTPKHRQLGLVVNEFIDDEEIVKQLRDIGRRALQSALVARPDLTVGLIVGEAREGRNYFRR